MIFTGADRGYLRLAHAIVSGEPHGDLRCPGCKRDDLLPDDFAWNGRYRSGNPRRCYLCRVCHGLRVQDLYLNKRKPSGKTPFSGVGTKTPPMAQRRYLQGLARARGFLPAAEVLERLGSPVQTHGTNASYSEGCRCEPCRTARREYKRAWRASKRRGALRRAS